MPPLMVMPLRQRVQALGRVCFTAMTRPTRQRLAGWYRETLKLAGWLPGEVVDGGWMDGIRVFHHRGASRDIIQPPL